MMGNTVDIDPVVRATENAQCLVSDILAIGQLQEGGYELGRNLVRSAPVGHERRAP